MSAGYSYVTISVDRGESARIGLSFHLDSHDWITVAGAGTDKPHLAIVAGDVSAAVSPAKPGQVTSEDAQLARLLATRAAEYADEIERLATANTTPGGPDCAAA